MTKLPPFMNSVGLIPKILHRAAEAQQPARFTQDFLGTKLGFPSGSAKPIIPLLKRLGMLQSDGTPTSLYSQFRNPSQRGAAMATALRTGYDQIFERNEYAHALTLEQLRNLIVEISGLVKDNSTVLGIVGTFLALREFADFDAVRAPESPTIDTRPEVIERIERSNGHSQERVRPDPEFGGEVGMNLSYTINLNLPESANPEVFNAIFKALRENLLRK